MSFLRRILGGASKPTSPPADADQAPATSAEADEYARDRELARAETERLGTDLIQRQLRYADRSWQPPAQGSTRRADDAPGAPED